MKKIILIICYVFVLFVIFPVVATAQEHDSGADTYNSDMEQQANEYWENYNSNQEADNFDLCDHETDYGSVESVPCPSSRKTKSGQPSNSNWVYWLIGIWGCIAVAFRIKR